MFAAVQKKEISCEIFVNHFKENKVEIANAITKPFPFLESLRDNSFITEKMYADSQEACINLIPVQRVVYHVLCHLEKVFDCSVLSVLFSRVNLKEYPDLIEIHKSFKKALPFSQKRDGKKTPKMPSFQPSCKQGVIHSGTRTETSEPVRDVKSTYIKPEHSILGPGDALGRQQANTSTQVGRPQGVLNDSRRIDQCPLQVDIDVTERNQGTQGSPNKKGERVRRDAQWTATW
uniref:HSR domain-containing protein n=1 Tax=Macaca fascicularis TaxID=9541 RepID=A0A7N9D5X6_MACFA